MTLARNPGFVAIAVAIFSLGSASVTALFSVVDKVLLEQLSYRDPDRLVQLITVSAELSRIGINGCAITLDWGVFAFTAPISVLVGIACRLIPVT